MQQDYEIDVQWAPYLLDPTTPPEGKPRRRMTEPDSPPTDMELRAEALGIKFTRGREITSNSHLALEAAEFAADKPQAWQFHRAMFKAYFEDIADIGTIETILRVAESVGLDAAALRASLESHELRDRVDDGIRWAREIGVTGVPTFVIDDQHGVVGAQDHDVFVRVFEQLGKLPRGT